MQVHICSLPAPQFPCPERQARIPRHGRRVEDLIDFNRAPAPAALRVQPALSLLDVQVQAKLKVTWKSRPPPAVKQCCDCGFEKALSKFHRNGNTRDGYTRRCSACTSRKYYERKAAQGARAAES